VTRDENHIADKDTENIENQGQVMGQVQNSVIAERGRRNPQKPGWITTNMIVTYALSAIEDVIPSTYREAKISSESGCERKLCWKR